eukprot:scaffold12471_cov55-Phaeocystis_antarctica.AAC.2
MASRSWLVSRWEVSLSCSSTESSLENLRRARGERGQALWQASAGASAGADDGRATASHWAQGD